MKTLAEFAELDTDAMAKGVMNWLYKYDPVLQQMGFQDISGNSLKYNVKDERAGAQFIQVNDDIPSKNYGSAQRSVALTILANDIFIPHFSEKTNSTQNIAAIEIAEGITDMRDGFLEALIYGGTTTSSTTNEPEGILKLIAELESTSTTDLDGLSNSQVIVNSATSAALTLAALEETIDAVKPEGDGGRVLLLTDRRCRRKVNALARASGSPLTQYQNNYGQFIAMYNSMPLVVSDYMRDNFQDGASSVLDISAYAKTTTRASGYDNSVILALKFGDRQFSGIQNGNLAHIKVAEHAAKKDASQHRFVWYVGCAIFNKFSAAVCIGINADT